MGKLVSRKLKNESYFLNQDTLTQTLGYNKGLFLLTLYSVLDSRLGYFIGYFIHFKFTCVSSIVCQSLHL